MRDGFDVTLDCVNVTFRAAVCQAISAMLAQVGIRVSFQPSPSSTVLSEADAGDHELLRVRLDAGNRSVGDAYNSVFARWDDGAAATFNGGRYSNPKLDALIDAIRVEPDLAKAPHADRRRAAHHEHAELPLVPLYRRKLTWVMRPNIDVVQWPNDVLELRWCVD